MTIRTMHHRALAPIMVALFAFGLLFSCASKPAKDPDAVSGMSFVPLSESSITDELLPVENPGRVLVVYFSQGTAARRVAEDLAALTGAHLEAIVELKKRGTGFFGFMGAGMDASFKAATPIAVPMMDPSKYDAVYVVSPVWSWNLCPPVRTWLRTFQGVLPRVAYVTVSGDTDPEKIVKAMAKEGGREPFASAGFAEKDFSPENRPAYLARIGTLVDPLREAR